jgi:hypothetical protein
MAVERYNLVVNVAAKGVNTATSKIKGFYGTLKKALNPAILGTFGAIAGAALSKIAKDFAQAAGVAETTNRRFVRVFGDLSKEMQQSAKEIAESTNRATSRIKSGLTSLQSFFQGLGFASKEASNFSKNIQGAAIDLASFFGTTDESAQKRFISALAGSPEVLDQFGINLKQAALQVELYNMGIKTTVQNTSEVIKTQARLNIINRAMTANGILGDAQRNVDSYGNQLKKLDSQMLEFKETVGAKVIPVLLSLNDILGETTEGLTNFLEKPQELKDAEAKKLREDVAAIVADQEEWAKASGQTLSRYELLVKTGEYLKQKIADSSDSLREQARLTKINREVQNEISNIERARAEGLQKIKNLQIDQINRLNEALDKESKRFKQEEGFYSDLKGIKNQDEDSLKRRLGTLGKQIQILDFLTNLSSEETQDLEDALALQKAITEELRRRGQLFTGELESRGAADLTVVPEVTVDMSQANPPDVRSLSEYLAAFADIGFSEEMAIIGKDIAMGIGAVFGDSIDAVLSGAKSFGQAFKEAIDEMAKAFAGDLTARAVYHGALGAVYAALGNFAEAGKHLGAAGASAAGALALGGLSAAIPNKRTGGGNFGQRQFTRLEGQSSFGQVLVAEVGYDKLRFMLNNGQSNSFRTNG